MTTETDCVAALQGVSHSFGDFQALQDVDLSVRRGDVYGLLGLNGAGKTTTLRILLRLLRCRSGEVTLFGRPQHSAWLEVAPRIGATIEAPAFYPQLDGLTNLNLLRDLGGVREGCSPEEALELTGLSDAARVRTQRYSQGMLQRLYIAQALLGSPALLVLDEPTSNLDPRGLVEVRELVRRLNRELGVTVVLSSHQLPEVEELCNRVAILHRGRVLAEAPVRELFEADESVLEIEVDRPDDALRVLDGLPWCTAPELVDGVLCTRVARTRRAELNALLVKQGLGVAQLVERRASLEDYFHRTIADDA